MRDQLKKPVVSDRPGLDLLKDADVVVLKQGSSSQEDMQGFIWDTVVCFATCCCLRKTVFTEYRKFVQEIGVVI